jgi:release factor glutamine methyltransferase
LATTPSLTCLDDLALREAASGRSRTQLIAHDLQLLEQEQALYERLLARYRAGEPLSYLFGHKEFFGRRFWVSPACLIPRPETEGLVEIGLEWVKAEGHRFSEALPLRLLDLGTGSGCLAITLSLELQALGIATVCYATDISEKALKLARNNAAWLGADVRFLQGSWLQALPDAEHQSGFDLIVSNPPYVGQDDPEFASGSLAWEPVSALLGLQPSKGGMNDLRQLVGQCLSCLKPGGLLAVEHGYRQQSDVINAFAEAGFLKITPSHDLAGRPRNVQGRL